MKRPIKLILIVGLPLLCAFAGAHYYLLDGLDGFIWSHMFQEDTRYSARYSDTAFRNVRVGMSETELIQLLGEPLRSFPPTSDRGWTTLWFSESQHDSHFRMRSINLRDGIIIGIQSEFYVD